MQQRKSLHQTGSGAPPPMRCIMHRRPVGSENVLSPLDALHPTIRFACCIPRNAVSRTVEIHASGSFDRHECAIRLSVVLNISDRIGSCGIIVAECAPIMTVGDTVRPSPPSRPLMSDSSRSTPSDRESITVARIGHSNIQEHASILKTGQII